MKINKKLRLRVINRNLRYWYDSLKKTSPFESDREEWLREKINYLEECKERLEQNND